MLKMGSLIMAQRCKSKVKSLYLINQARRHGDAQGSGGIAPSFLTSELDGGKWSASRPGFFIPMERATNTHHTEGYNDVQGGHNIVM
jgi:hypothetical protein